MIRCRRRSGSFTDRAETILISPEQRDRERLAGGPGQQEQGQSGRQGTGGRVAIRTAAARVPPSVQLRAARTAR